MNVKNNKRVTNRRKGMIQYFVGTVCGIRYVLRPLPNDLEFKSEPLNEKTMLGHKSNETRRERKTVETRRERKTVDESE